MGPLHNSIIIMSLRGLLFSAASPLRHPSYTTNTWPIKPPALPMSEIRPELRINKTSPGPPFQCKDTHMEKIFLYNTKETTYTTNHNKSRSTPIANSFTHRSYIIVYRLLKKRRNTILVSNDIFWCSTVTLSKRRNHFQYVDVKSYLKTLQHCSLNFQHQIRI